MTIIEYVTEEVSRQGHDVSAVDGLERVGGMLDAWCFAMMRSKEQAMKPPIRSPMPGSAEALWVESSYPLPTVVDVIEIGRRIERQKNALGLRKCNVTVGSRACPRWEKVPRLLVEWGEWVQLGVNVEPFDAYRRLLEVHPFEDGNGRTGKVILNWLNGTLNQPVFPPDDFWGRPIRNP